MLIPYISYKTDPKYQVSLNLVKKIRSGRKMFKLLKFIDEYKEFVYEASEFNFSKLYGAFRSICGGNLTASDTPVWSNAFQVITKIASVVYYLLDNVIWFLNVGVVSKKVVTKSYWKEWKDIFNLLRNYTQIFRSILLFYKVY